MRWLEKEPPLAGGTPGVRPGRSVPRVPALARVVGQQHQKAWTTGTEEDGSVTHKDGSGWALNVSRDNLEEAGYTAQLASQGAWNWGGSDQEHQHCSSWGSHLGSSAFQAVSESLDVPEHSHQEAPAGPCWSENLD